LGNPRVNGLTDLNECLNGIIGSHALRCLRASLDILPSCGDPSSNVTGESSLRQSQNWQDQFPSSGESSMMTASRNHSVKSEGPSATATTITSLEYCSIDIPRNSPDDAHADERLGWVQTFVPLGPSRRDIEPYARPVPPDTAQDGDFPEDQEQPGFARKPQRPVRCMR